MKIEDDVVGSVVNPLRRAEGQLGGVDPHAAGRPRRQCAALDSLTATG